MVETIFTNPLFVQTILPFLLVFTLIFAVLEKTKILGEGKRQIDAIVALVIGLIFVSFGGATDIVVRMIPILGIAVVVILIFMILFGFAYQEGDFKMPDGLKITLGILAGLLVIGMVLILTGGIDYILGFIYSGSYPGLIMNIILIAVIVGAIVSVVWTGKGESSGGKGKGG
ncbi:MAG: hypothetical protein Q7S27_04275 [Nanoarchaeota archaeon]|nr:hypothetical protein [Nanoarchaeota archaeon]